jgi:hypothetical protein
MALAIPSGMISLALQGMSANRLVGSIPASIGKLDLVEIYFYANHLSGAIPSSVTKMATLINLALQCEPFHWNHTLYYRRIYQTRRP